MIRILYVVLFLFCTSVAAAERPRIGLALSGGGARGAAHIGILKELERQRIPIDYIAGTSIGAIVGGMYAAGMSTAEMEQVLTETDWDGIFKDEPPRKDSSMRRKLDDQIFQVNKELGYKDGKLVLPSGFVQGQKLQLLLEKLFLPVADINDFDELPIPFRAVATDITTSEAVVLGAGSLATSVRASMSVPSVFATVKHDDRMLVDGGISNNLPVDVVREMGADVVIAVDIGTPLLGENEVENVIDITLQLTNILVRRTTDAQIATLKNSDILITPELGKFSSADFKGATRIIPNGVEAAEAQADNLRRLVVTKGEFDQYAAGRDEPDNPLPVIGFIRIENDSPLSDDYIRSKLHQRLGEPLDFIQLEQDISTIYGLEIFQIIEYRVVKEAGQAGLVVNLQHKPWGPKYLQFGLRYASDNNDNNNLGISLGYTVTPLNLWNGEWRTILQLGEEPGLLTEFNQPLGIDSRYYANGRLEYSNERFNIFKDNIKLNQVRAKTFALTGALGREFGHWGDLRAGLTRFVSENRVEIGPLSDLDRDYDGGEFFARFHIDTYDDAFFPTEGVRGFAQYLGSRTDLGADSEFDQALFDLAGAASWNRNTVFFGARYFSTVEGRAPISNAFRLGGLFELPGFVDNELSGQNLYLVRSAYQRKLTKLFNTTPYLGVTVQYGQLFENKEDIDFSDGIVAGGVWLGWKSVVGPIYVGYGRADTGNTSLYLIMGNRF